MTTASNTTYPQGSSSKPLVLRERDIEDAFIEKLRGLKYTHRDDIRDRAALEQNFRRTFETLNRVRLTTGSGKTLTSFKAATLLKDNPAIDKCLFVVDRKDLDRQTREEFNRFQEKLSRSARRRGAGSSLSKKGDAS